MAAATLLVEKVRLLEDPDYIPSCSISPILSCGSVMQTDQAEAFGFPNPIVGVAGFAILSTLGIVLIARFEPPRWMWFGLQAGVSFGVVFVHWLIFQSLYRIGALCPYCMVVWVVTIPTFWYVTLHNLHASQSSLKGGGRAAGALADNHAIVLTAWYLVIVGLIARRFWDYWTSLAT